MSFISTQACTTGTSLDRVTEMRMWRMEDSPEPELGLGGSQQRRKKPNTWMHHENLKVASILEKMSESVQWWVHVQ